MLKRPSAAIKWVIALSVPLGLVAFLPAASWVYAELGRFEFTPWVWLAGLQHEVSPQNLLLAGLAGVVSMATRTAPLVANNIDLPRSQGMLVS